jgi:hypothetical protein
VRKVASVLGLPLLVMSAGTFASPLFAQSVPAPALTFEWSAPPECPSSAEVLAETRRLLGGPPPLRSNEHWTARAVASHAGIWSVSIETSSASGPHSRTLHAQTCRGLADATALILALAINPEALAVAAPAPMANSSSSTATPPATVPIPSSAPSRPTKYPIRLSVGGCVSVSAGVLPAIDYGVGVAIAARVDSILLELAVYDWLRPVTATIQGSTAGGTFGLVSGTLYACDAFRAGAFEFGPCAQLDVGRIEATGFGVTRITTATALWLAAGAGAIGVVRLDASGTWTIPIHLDLLVPLERRAFVVQNVPGDVYHQPPIAGRAAIALEYRFR